MREGKKWELLVMKGPDDPPAKKVLASGEPSFDAMTAYYPGKILDRTVPGAWCYPDAPMGDFTELRSAICSPPGFYWRSPGVCRCEG